MKANKIFDVLDLALRARDQGRIFNPCFISEPGIGKTEMQQQWAKSQGDDFGVLVLTLSNYDPPDFKGFPNIITDSKGRQRQTFATPDFWPDSGRGIIILEEMNRAPTSIMQCILSLGDARRGFDGYKLPEGWIISASINPEGGDCDVNTMDPALKDRFEMFNVTYDKKGFVEYMNVSEWHRDIVNFVESNTWGYKTPSEVGNAAGAKYISPRTFSKLNAALLAGITGDLEHIVYDTELGSLVAKDFYNFRYNETPVMMSDLRKNLRSSLKKLQKFSNPDNYKNGMISLTVKDIIEDKTIEDELLVEVIKVIPVEQSTGLIRDLEFKRKDEQLLLRLCSQYKEIKDLYKAILAQEKKEAKKS